MDLPDPSTIVWVSWLQLVMQLGTLVFLTIYVIKTWQMASATRAAAQASSRAADEALKARLQGLAPRILVYFNPEQIFFAEIVVENAGAGTAKDVEFKFDPPLQSSERNHHPEKFFETPKSIIPPGHRIRLHFDSWPALLQSQNPRRYTVQVAYRGAENNLEYGVTHVLDVGDHEHRVELHRKGMHDLVGEVEKLRNELTGRLDRFHREISVGLATRGYAAFGRGSFNDCVAALKLKTRMLKDWALSGGFDVWWDPALADLRAEALVAAAQAERENLAQAKKEAALAFLETVYRHGRVGDDKWLQEIAGTMDNLYVVAHGDRSATMEGGQRAVESDGRANSE